MDVVIRCVTSILLVALGWMIWQWGYEVGRGDALRQWSKEFRELLDKIKKERT